MTIQEILADYETKRINADYTARITRRKIFDENPKLKALEDRKTALLMGNMAAALRGEATDIQDEVKQITRQIYNMAAELGIELRDIEPKYECPICADHGFVDLDGKREYCVCLKRRIYQDEYHAQLSSTMRGSFDDFDATLYPRAAKIKEFALKYLDKYPDNPRKNVVLTGNAGQGKTYLMECVAKELYNRNSDVLYLSSIELNRLFHAHRLGELWLLWPIYEAGMLLIDDLGTEPMTNNVTREYYYDLYDHRLRGGLHTWTATNLKSKEINVRYGERTASRMFDNRNTAVVKFLGEDLRLKEDE